MAMHVPKPPGFQQMMKEGSRVSLSYLFYYVKTDV